MKVRDIAESIGFEQVSLSSVVMPMCRVVFRGHTACADAYLTPSIKRYVSGMWLTVTYHCVVSVVLCSLGYCVGQWLYIVQALKILRYNFLCL